MTALTETLKGFNFLITELDGRYSRDNATVLSGEGVLVAGTVVGKVAHAGATAAAYAGNTGTGAMGAITLGAGAKVGAYKLTIVEPGTDAGIFIVEDPDGIELGSGKVAVAYSKGGLSFTLADATDFVSGDGFTITVAAGSGKLRAWDPTHIDGSEVVAGILGYGVDATSADVATAIIARGAEVNTNLLTYPAGQAAAAKSGLAALFPPVLVR
jgi:hypothetical protein